MSCGQPVLPPSPGPSSKLKPRSTGKHFRSPDNGFSLTDGSRSKCGGTYRHCGVHSGEAITQYLEYSVGIRKHHVTHRTNPHSSLPFSSFMQSWCVPADAPFMYESQAQSVRSIAAASATFFTKHTGEPSGHSQEYSGPAIPGVPDALPRACAGRHTSRQPKLPCGSTLLHAQLSVGWVAS